MGDLSKGNIYMPKLTFYLPELGSIRPRKSPKSSSGNFISPRKTQSVQAETVSAQAESPFAQGKPKVPKQKLYLPKMNLYLPKMII